MADTHFRLPLQLDMHTGNVADNFKKWKRQTDLYISEWSRREVKEDPDSYHSWLCRPTRDWYLWPYDQISFEKDDDKNDPEKMYKKLQEYCNPRQSEVIESFRFWNVPYQQPFDTFLMELRTWAEQCDFKEQKECMIRDKIVFTVQGK